MDYRFYVWSQWFGKNLTQLGSILAVIFGAGMISTEVSRKTMQFLLAKPLSRQDIFTAKYVVNYIILALTVVISTLALYIGIIVAGRSYPLGLIVESTVIATAGLGVVFSMAAYFSAIFDRTLISVVVSALAALALSVPGYFPALVKYSLYYQMAGIGIIKNEEFPLVMLAVLVLVSAVLYMLGRTRFARRDL